MSNSVIIKALLLFMAAAVIASPALASLSPMSFGFPVLMQNGQSTAIHLSDTHQFNIADANVNFPVMRESGISGQTVTATDFQQNSAFSSFSYPAVGVGASGLPGFWF
jgi:hypothetical protein